MSNPKSALDILAKDVEPSQDCFVSIDLFIVENQQFNSLDHVVELSSDFGDPFELAARHEREMGAPLAMCTTVINARGNKHTTSTTK